MIIDADEDGSALLINAVKQGDFLKLKALLDQGVDINTIDSNGSSLVQIALEHNQINITSWILTQPEFYNMDNFNEDGETALHYAVRYDHHEVVMTLVKSMDQHAINVPDRDGFNVLHYAATKGYVDIFQYLLQDFRFTEFNASCYDGTATALTLAIKHGHDDIAEQLLQNAHFDNFDVVDSENDYTTALQLAIMHGYTNVTKLILEHENCPDVNAENIQDGNTALHYACTCDRADIVTLLLNSTKLIEVNSENRHRRTPLMLAIQNKAVNSLKVLVNEKRASYELETLLFAYVRSSDSLEILELLIKDAQCPIYFRDQHGYSLLFCAFKSENAHVATLFVIRMLRDLGVPVETCMSFVHEVVKMGFNHVKTISNGNEFDNWIRDVLLFFKDINNPDIDWTGFITHITKNPLISSVSMHCDKPSINHALNILRMAFHNSSQAEVLHIHLVGDGKAGKSVATHWLIDLLVKANECDLTYIDSKDVVSHTTDVQSGRTRGVHTTTLRFQSTITTTARDFSDMETSYIKDNVVIIHDYGGQEEFLSNHANFLSTNNSIYIILIPLLQIGDTIQSYRLRNISEMLERYLFWCRFVFSVVHREQSFPKIASQSSTIVEALQQIDPSQEQNVGQQGIGHHCRGIPMLTLINRFKTLCDDEMYDNHIQNAIPVLERQLRNEFTISYDAVEDCDYLLPNYLSFTLDGPFYITDNANNEQMLGVAMILMDMMKNNGIMHGKYYRASISDYIASHFDLAHLPVFMTEHQWEEWLTESIRTWESYSDLLCNSTVLSMDEQHKIVNILMKYCEDSLLTMNKIMTLKEQVNGYRVITNPSVLSTEILGDLLWWFHKYRNAHEKAFDIEGLRLSQESILAKLHIVDQERKAAGLQSPNNKVITAMDYLSNLPNGIESLPLVELLNKMDIGLEVYDEHKNEMQSWLLGIAPDFPKGRKELRFDWWPDHEIRRYFRLPDTRACFIPGYFLRLFVNMVNNKDFELVEGYGNAAKLRASFHLPTTDPNDDNYSKCEIQVLLCQLSDKDQDAVIVSVAGKGNHAMTHTFHTLNLLRGFIYGDSWGLNFQEFCLPLWHVHDQKRLSRLREDLLDEKKAIDEIIPFIFGIPQIVERDPVMEAESSTLNETIHDECVSVRHAWKEWFFGGKPDVNQAKLLTKEEQQEYGLMLLRENARYQPTTSELASGKFLTHKRTTQNQNLCSIPQETVDEEILFIELSDILQRYAESCYDTSLHSIVYKAGDSVEDMVYSLITSSSIENHIDCDDEAQMRETLYRCLKLFYNRSSTTTKVTTSPKVSLQTFDMWIDKWLEYSKQV